VIRSSAARPHCARLPLPSAAASSGLCASGSGRSPLAAAAPFAFQRCTSNMGEQASRPAAASQPAAARAARCTDWTECSRRQPAAVRFSEAAALPLLLHADSAAQWLSALFDERLLGRAHARATPRQSSGRSTSLSAAAAPPSAAPFPPPHRRMRPSATHQPSDPFADSQPLAAHRCCRGRNLSRASSSLSFCGRPRRRLGARSSSVQSTPQADQIRSEAQTAVCKWTHWSTGVLHLTAPTAVHSHRDDTTDGAAAVWLIQCRLLLKATPRRASVGSLDAEMNR